MPVEQRGGHHVGDDDVVDRRVLERDAGVLRVDDAVRMGRMHDAHGHVAELIVDVPAGDEPPGVSEDLFRDVAVEVKIRHGSVSARPPTPVKNLCVSTNHRGTLPRSAEHGRMPGGGHACAPTTTFGWAIEPSRSES